MARAKTLATERHTGPGTAMCRTQSLRIHCHCGLPLHALSFLTILSKIAVRELILRGCNPNTGSGTGETALHTMAAFGHVDCAKALKALCGKELILQPRDKVRRSNGGPLCRNSRSVHAPEKA